MNTATIQTVRPPTGTQEWAASNVNIQDGCEHDCLYCYAKTMAIRFKRATPASWKRPQFRQHDLDRGFTRRSGRIMFPTAHDITDQNIDECLAVLDRMLAAGNDLLIVSKPRLSCAKRLCEELAQYRDTDRVPVLHRLEARRRPSRPGSPVSSTPTPWSFRPAFLGSPCWTGTQTP
jgi:DNA repair photolyase